MEYRTIEHTFEPVYDSESRILILGSLPSVKSRENNFYYGHPQNRFWRGLWEIFGESGTGKNEVKEFCGGNMQGDGSVSEKLGDKVSGMQKGKNLNTYLTYFEIAYVIYLITFFPLIINTPFVAFFTRRPLKS